MHAIKLQLGVRNVHHDDCTRGGNRIVGHQPVGLFVVFRAEEKVCEKLLIATGIKDGRVKVFKVSVLQVFVGTVSKSQIVVELELVHLHDLLKARVEGRDVFEKVILGQSMGVVFASFSQIYFAHVHELLLSVELIKAVADFVVLLVVEDPGLLEEIPVTK